MYIVCNNPAWQAFLTIKQIFYFFFCQTLLIPPNLQSYWCLVIFKANILSRPGLEARYRRWRGGGKYCHEPARRSAEGVRVIRKRVEARTGGGKYCWFLLISKVTGILWFWVNIVTNQLLGPLRGLGCLGGGWRRGNRGKYCCFCPRDSGPMVLHYAYR